VSGPKAASAEGGLVIRANAQPFLSSTLSLLGPLQVSWSPVIPQGYRANGPGCTELLVRPAELLLGGN